MYIEATVARDRENGGWKDQTVSDDDYNVGIESCHRFALCAKRVRLMYRQPMSKRMFLYRARAKFSASPGGPVGLGVDSNERMAGGVEALQRR